MQQLVFGAALVFVAGAAQGQTVPEQRFGQPELEYREGFTAVRAVAEMSVDRVIVVARFPAGPSMLDLRGGTLAPISRKGQGPGEWSNISRAIPLATDSVMLSDAGRRTLMAVARDGSVHDVGQIAGLSAEAIDAQGRVYYPGAGGAIANAAARARQVGGSQTPSAAVSGRRDSLALVREDLRLKRSDTIGFLRLRDSEMRSEVATSQGTLVMAGLNGPVRADVPVLPTDIAAFGRDGRVAIVRSPEYRVEWVLADGRKVMGNPIAFQPIPNRPPVRSAIVAPSGEVWVERERPASDSTPVYDVVNSAGALVRRVRLPDHSRLIALGNGVAYIVRVDQDDLEYLGRYRLP